ncbi:MAG: 16S rRNA (uracil(1498)-N(3))-methyltransferase [Sphingobacteriaceae bacterium]|nr:16S rRNA (uracil(1498)-N(3))-methyltransferase [Sphingobacteriaceae bacterium]
MHLFYTPDITGDTYQLNEEESRHCSKVLRLESGDQIQLIDGKGGFYTAEIIDPHPKRTLVKTVVHHKEYGKRNHYLHIAVAPTKNIDRFEWFLEKATEIGIDEITPIICDRSERKEVKTDRLNKIITSAVKQSIKAYHPKLNEPCSYKNFITKPFSEKFIAHCIEEGKSTLNDKITTGGEYVILIGPEGDFTPSEIRIAVLNGYIPITLGASRLRTETAALEACFEINFLNR